MDSLLLARDVDPRGWRGVIDRAGREDSKVSETSQECDRGAKKHSHRGTDRDGGGDVREKVGTK